MDTVSAAPTIATTNLRCPAIHVRTAVTLLLPRPGDDPFRPRRRLASPVAGRVRDAGLGVRVGGQARADGLDVDLSVRPLLLPPRQTYPQVSQPIRHDRLPVILGPEQCLHPVRDGLPLLAGDRLGRVADRPLTGQVAGGVFPPRPARPALHAPGGPGL